MSKLALGIVVLSLVVAAVGCAAPAQAPQPAEQVVVEQVVERPAAQPAQPMDAASASGGAAEGPAGDTERMIVRTADLSVVVTDAAQAQQSVVDAVQGMGGYVADSSAWREGEQLRARMTVRVPADKLDALLASVKALAVRVQQENVKGQDVTEEYTDLNAQLTNLEATEVELRELLAEVRQKTQKAEDVLQVYRELTNIRGEIERTKGRMQYLSTMTAMATANVDLVPDALAKPVVEPGWRPLETLKDAGRALVNALKGLVNALIWIVIYVLPLLIVIAIPVVLVVLVIRWLVRRSRRRPQAPTSGQ
jgi:hypothetical protein